MNVTPADLVAQIGELSVANRALKRELAAAQNRAADLERQNKIVTAALAAKDQAKQTEPPPENSP